MPKKTIDDIDPAGLRCLVRVDFNVPLGPDGTVADDRRIRSALPTIRSIVDRGGRAVLMSHLGRPKGEGFEPALSLRPVAERLAELLGTPVTFPAEDCTQAGEAVDAMQDGDCLLLENLRFHQGEKAGDDAFAAQLARYADAYVNDAFGTCHREDASMVAVPRKLEGKPRVTGFLVEREIRYLAGAINDPTRPFIVVLGGAKVSDKLPAIKNLLPVADHILVGGAMAYTFLKAHGTNVGDSLVEDGYLKEAEAVLDRPRTDEHGRRTAELHLPTDHVCSTQFDSTTGDIEVFEGDIKDGFMGLDIGPETQTAYAQRLESANTVIWNGPMGVFEQPPMAVGTRTVARALADITARGATTVVGGGDSAAAAEKFGVADKLSHISTGGGASLEMLQGKRFAAVALLDEA